jgi:K+-transporting ATPase ATPase C chain
MIKQLKPTILIFIAMVVITGIIYPLVITGAAQVLFPFQANGSLITRSGQPVGSELIGQQFDQPKYFWGRLSDTGDHAYNAAISSGSNYSVLNQSLQDAVNQRIKDLKAADPSNSQPIPVDLVTASGSGLDPEISIAAARYQANRVAKAHNLTLDQVNTLIDQHTRGRQFGFLGEPGVNVMELNLALDALQ